VSLASILKVQGAGCQPERLAIFQLEDFITEIETFLSPFLVKSAGPNGPTL